MLIVVATLKAKAGKEAEMEEVLKGLVEQVKQEKDTLVYVMHRNQANPGEFLFYEKYPSADALAAHSSTDYFKASFATLDPLLAEKPVISMYEEVASI